MAEECKNCVHKSNFKAVECGTCTVDYFDGVQRGLPTNYKARPMTNADRIRAMTDEELAKECVRQFPMYLWANGIRAIYFDMENHKKDKAIKAWMQWLQQPAEGD